VAERHRAELGRQRARAAARRLRERRRVRAPAPQAAQDDGAFWYTYSESSKPTNP